MRKAFLASKALGLKLLRTIDLTDALILHPDDRTDARSEWPEFEKRARMVGNRAEADEALRGFAPDIVFVCGWYWLIADEIRALASKGFFGIHNGLLPQYRGGAPLVWAIINGEREVGSSLFRLEAGVDDGAIAHQVRINLTRRETVADATARIEAAWEATFPAIWQRLCEGTQPLAKQDISGTPQWPNRKPADGAIDWTLPAARIHDFIRAQSAPYPGAFGDMGIIERSEESWLTLDTPVGVPILIGGATFVRCGDGKALRISLRQSHAGTITRTAAR